MGEKRVFTPEHLEKLKVAREKALVVRQKKAQEKLLVKNLEKDLVTKEHEVKVDTIKTKLDKLNAKPPPPESESESEPDAPVVIKKKKKKAKKIVIVEESDSDEEQQQIIYVKRTKPQIQQIQQPIPQPSAPIPIPQQPQPPQRRSEAEIYNEFYQRNRRGF